MVRSTDCKSKFRSELLGHFYLVAFEEICPDAIHVLIHQIAKEWKRKAEVNDSYLSFVLQKGSKGLGTAL